MSRIKRGVVTKRRHKRLLKQTKGFWGQRKNVFKRAKETLLRAMRFAYIGRRLKKRDFRGVVYYPCQRCLPSKQRFVQRIYA